MNVDPSGTKIMVPKGDFYVLKTHSLQPAGANILKQQMLSVGGECAVSRGVANCEVDQSPTILMGSRKQFQRLIQGLEGQYFGLADLKYELIDFFHPDHQIRTYRFQDRHFDLNRKTVIMGILNVTPDSFSDGGEFEICEAAVEQALKMEQEGADIIDIGGESTRPGADPVDLDTELERVLPVIEAIRETSNIAISIDTYKSAVAVAALEKGANIVNDISGLTFDPEMAEVIKDFDAGCCLMHIKGEPKNMQQNPQYDNMLEEILVFLMKSAETATESGIPKDHIILDPGIGFGKPWLGNYDILRHLKEFRTPGIPLLVGPSRKSFIGNLLDLPPEERLEGTLAAITASILNGADFIRVHDVKACYRAAVVADKIAGKG